MKLKVFRFLFLSFSLISSNLNAVAIAPSVTLDQKVTHLLDKTTLEGKIGQMGHSFYAKPKTTLPKD
jgi:hypothetical protein